MQLLINAQTSAVTSNSFFPPEDQKEVAMFVTGLSAGELVTVQFSIDGVNFVDLYQYGRLITMDYQNNALGVYCPCHLRVVKGVTASPVTVAVATKVR